jgi:hypothetical protein
MTEQHPITPPPELVQQWLEQLYGGPVSLLSQSDQRVIVSIAQWGADQELEACCELTRDNDGYDAALALRASRRPKPLSLKEQALEALRHAPGPDYPNPITLLTADEHALIRRALEALPE